jgi:hypothetical protein
VTIDESFTVTTTAPMVGTVTVRRDIGMTLGNLVKPWRALEWVKPTATVEEAMTRMLINDYSQLPVLKSKHDLVGAVTWQSIARARPKGPGAPLSHAVVSATQLTYSDDLHAVPPRLQDEDSIVVANPHNEITGILTTADVVGLYHERTLPFLLIGELDQELRQLIEVMISFDVAEGGHPARAVRIDLFRRHDHGLLPTGFLEPRLLDSVELATGSRHFCHTGRRAADDP